MLRRRTWFLCNHDHGRFVHFAGAFDRTDRDIEHTIRELDDQVGGRHAQDFHVMVNHAVFHADFSGEGRKDPANHRYYH